MVTVYKVVEPAHTALLPVIGGVVGVELAETANITGVPTPQGEVSVTLTLPPVAPKVTVIEFVVCPLVIVAPAGTVQA